MKNIFRLTALCIVSGALALPALAQQKTTPSVSEHTVAKNASTSTWTAEQVIPMTIHEAWTASGKDEAAFFDMVKVLAEYSSQKRGLTLPDNHADGVKFGEFIKAHAKLDRDQLLYVVVDEAVRHVGKAAPVAGQ